MKSLKKYQILIIFVSFAIVFYIFQLSFLSHLKQMNIDSKSNPKIFKIREFRSAKETKLKQKILIINKTEYLIPLDSNFNAQLIDILPFNQNIEYLNKFKKTLHIEKSLFLMNQSFDYSNALLKTEYENHDFNSGKILSLPTIRGVDKKNQFLYQSKLNKFKCLNSNVCNFKYTIFSQMYYFNLKQIIPYDQLNDNYCDCVDGTDEPGTNACQFG